MRYGYIKPEQLLAKDVAYYLRMQYPDVLFRFDLNGLNLSKTQAGMNKSIQKRKGFPDLEIFAASGNKSQQVPNIWHGLLIELKTEGTRIFLKDGRTYASEHLKEQAACHLQLVKAGYYACFACGFDEVKSVIDKYLANRI